jgi:hypothetical protein
MRSLVKTLVSVAVAAFATLALPGVSTSSTAYARGGGGGGGRGGPSGGTPKAGKGKKAGNQNGNKTGLGTQTPTDYLEELMRDESDANRGEFLFGARDAALVRSGEDDRNAAQRAQRNKASEDRRDAAESGAHPL